MKIEVKLLHFGFTRVDAAAFCSVFCLLCVTLMSCRKKTNDAIYVTECSYNLRMIHVASATFMQDNNAWVTKISTNRGGTMELSSENDAAHDHFTALFPNPRSHGVLLCPNDIRPRPVAGGALGNSAISYFLSLNVQGSEPQWILAGTRNLSVQEEVIVGFSTNTLLRWHSQFRLHGTSGFLAFMDGRVDSKARGDVPPRPSGTTNFVIFP